MKKKELATLLESVSLQDLKKVISQKGKLGPLRRRRK